MPEPIYIYVDKNTDKIELSKQELEGIIKKAYEIGIAEGKKIEFSSHYFPSYPSLLTSTPPWQSVEVITTTKPLIITD